MNTNKNIKPRYEVTTYDGQEITTRTMTRQQVMEINHQSVDYFLSAAFGIWGFRTDQDEWVEYNAGDWPGLGDRCIRIIQAIQFNPGDFLTPQEIANLTGRSTLRDNNALSARLMKIREVHNETAQKPHFFQSRRPGEYAIAWNPEKTWMWIERITPATDTTE